MPTKLPRVNVTVTEEQHSLLSEMASLNGGSAAGFVRQLLDQVTPILRAVVPAMRTASEEMNAAQTSLNSILLAARDAGLNLDQLDLLDPPSEAVQRTERSEGGHSLSGNRKPPSSNTGVRSAQKGNKSR